MCSVNGFVSALALVATGLLVNGNAQASPPATLDLNEAIELASKNSPVLAVARERIAEARGDVAGASVLFAHNPELEVSLGRRSPGAVGAVSTTDVELGVWQRFEIAGQRGDRIDSARASAHAADATADDVQRVVELAVAIAFFDALAAEEKLRIWQEGEQLTVTLLDQAKLRLERGDGTPLEVNTAVIRHAEAKRRTLAARAAQETALLRQRALLGYAAGESGRDVLIIYSGIPFAAVGAILALWLRGIPFSVSAAVGFVALAGIAVLNGQILIGAVREYAGRGASARVAVVEAAKTRLRPVLATGITDAAGFIPMALSTGVGSEVQRPLATVVVGGIITSTLLTLVVLPVLAFLFGNDARRERAAKDEGVEASAVGENGDRVDD